MSDYEVKSAPVDEVVFDADDVEGYVKATFATMDVIDLHGDVLMPGSIAKKGKKPVRMSAYNHGSWPDWFSEGSYPVGKGEIWEDGNKAIFEGNMFLDMPGVPELHKLLRNMGTLQEWSFSLQNIKREAGNRDGREVNFIKSVYVHEVSPVWKGAGIGTRTQRVKTAMEGELEEIRERYEALKAENVELLGRIKGLHGLVMEVQR